MKFSLELFTKEMTRKDFLMFAGTAISSIFGVNNFISYLLARPKQTHVDKVSEQSSSHGFGSSKFGS